MLFQSFQLNLFTKNPDLIMTLTIQKYWFVLNKKKKMMFPTLPWYTYHICYKNTGWWLLSFVGLTSVADYILLRIIISFVLNKDQILCIFDCRLVSYFASFSLSSRPDRYPYEFHNLMNSSTLIEKNISNEIYHQDIM